MKIINNFIVAIIVLVSFCYGYAQEFGDIGSKLVYEKEGALSLFFVPKIFSITKDEYFQGKICKVIDSNDEFPFDVKYIYQDSNKIYFHKNVYGKDTFLLFFDTGSNIGDTLEIGIRNAGYIDENTNDTIYSISILIDSIIYVRYCDINRKVWYIHPITELNPQDCNEIGNKYIEGIGYDDIFIPYLGCLSPPLEEKIRCFEIEDSLVCKLVNYDCDSIIRFNGLDDFDEEITIELIPNPVSDNLLINLRPNEKWQEWSIFDIKGRKIKSGNIKFGTSKLKLYGFDELKQGIYFLMLKGKNGKRGIGKFVVE